MRKVALVAMLVGVELSGIVGTGTFARAQSTPQATPGVALSPCQFKVGLGDTQYSVDAKCGTLQVPEDYSKPASNQITLHFTVLAATSPTKQPEPIFHFEGGPGASAIQNVGMTFYAAYRVARRDHDLVLLDQRGTGLSSSLQCTEITDKALQVLSKAETPLDTLAQLGEFAACAKRLSATTNPADYTSITLADDTDAVRTALGYDQIDIYGDSYGTWLAQIYLRRHGSHVHAMVLDSVAGPWNYYLLDAANNAQLALNKIFALCQADSDCNKAYPSLATTLNKVLTTLDKAPASATAPGTLTNNFYPVTVTRLRFLEALRQAMYLGANISIIPQMIGSAAAGDFTLTASMLVLDAETEPLVSLGLYYSVNCSETLPFYTPALIQRYQHGSFYGMDNSGALELQALCKVWPSAKLNTSDVAPVTSTRPVLILSGAFDPITSLAFGQEAHSRLTNSTLAVFPYEGHGPMVASKCAQNMVASFFDAPTKALDTSCTAKDVKPIFAGAYKVSLAPYSDPAGTFSASIPQGWKPQAKESDKQLTFFASPDGSQLLGIGIYKNTNAQAARTQAFASISKAYGTVDVQLSKSLFFVTILQHALDRPDQSYIGAMITSQLGPDTHVVWLAAPANIVQATLMPILLPVLTSLRA